MVVSNRAVVSGMQIAGLGRKSKWNVKYTHVKYTQTSMAKTSLGPWQFVLDMGYMVIDMGYMVIDMGYMVLDMGYKVCH